MTLDDYTRNVRGINNGSDFSPEFLVSFAGDRYRLTTEICLE